MSQAPHLSGGQIHVLTDASADEAQLSGAYFNAVAQFLDDGDTSHLAPFEGRSQRGLPFDTNPDVIEDWFLSTDFDFQEIYEP